MASYMEKTLAARRVLKKEQTKEEVAKELRVQVSTVDSWCAALKKVAIREHIRMEEAGEKRGPVKAKEKKKSKPKVKLPEPEKNPVQHETPTKPTVAEPAIKAPVKEEEPWDLI